MYRSGKDTIAPRSEGEERKQSKARRRVHGKPTGSTQRQHRQGFRQRDAVAPQRDHRDACDPEGNEEDGGESPR